jgi:hypothetical protein
VGLLFAWQNHKAINFRETGKLLKERYEGESKIIRNVDTYCVVGYTAGWA